MNRQQACMKVLLLLGCWLGFMRVGWSQALPADPSTSNVPGVVSYCVDPDWPPFERIDAQGQHTGIAADLLRLVAQRSGMNVQLVVTKDWDESLAASQAGRCQLMSFLNQTPKRDAWLVFTDPVLVDENVLITREEHPFVSDLAALTGVSMVLPKGTSVEERLRRDYPNVKLQLVESEEVAFRMVSERQADMTMRSLIVAADTIKRKGWFNLKIAGQVPGYGSQLRMGVLKSKVALRDRFNQGVRSITPQERQKIINQHVTINMVTAIDYTLLGWLAALLVAVLGTSAFWIRRLHQVNAQLEQASHTDALTGLRNRTGFDTLYLRDLALSRRTGQALSVVLVDVDFFKRVNDQLGHPAGDRVLQDVARLLQTTARDADCLIRWGGEEFLLICVATSGEQAHAMAQRCLQAARTHDFGLPWPLTLSAGVASLAPQDEPGHLFEQVDAALYQAKNSGRDRVVVYSNTESCAWP